MTTDAQRLARAQELALNILLLWRARYADAALPSLWPYMPSDFYYAAVPLIAELHPYHYHLSAFKGAAVLQDVYNRTAARLYNEEEGRWEKQHSSNLSRGHVTPSSTRRDSAPNTKE